MGVTPLNKGSSGPTNHLLQWLDPAGESLASVLWLDDFTINTPQLRHQYSLEDPQHQDLILMGMIDDVGIGLFSPTFPISCPIYTHDARCIFPGRWRGRH